MNEELKFTKLNPPEAWRVYLYPNGPDAPHEVRFENVTAICVRPSGSNRLEMADGTKAIVLPGFIAVRFAADAWTF